jgi:hypothetical protein
VTLQLGQCGNQVGAQLFHTLAREAATAPPGLQDQVLSQFFRDPISGAERDGGLPVARSVLIDMEPKVIADTLSSARASPFWRYSPHRTFSQQSGSANNWAFGYAVHGPAHEEQIMDVIRREVECCDVFSAALLLQSLAGGTGSGVGTYVSERLRDAYPKALLANHVVWPYSIGEVIVQNLNAVLSLAHLHSASSGLLVVQNDAVHNVAAETLGIARPSFGDLNAIIAQHLAAVLLPSHHALSPTAPARLYTAPPQKSGRHGYTRAPLLPPWLPEGPDDMTALLRRAMATSSSVLAHDHPYSSAGGTNDGLGGDGGSYRHSLGLSDICSHLFTHPSYRLSALTAIPHVSRRAKAFESTTWQYVLRHLLQAHLTPGHAFGTGSDVATALGEGQAAVAGDAGRRPASARHSLSSSEHGSFSAGVAAAAAGVSNSAAAGVGARARAAASAAARNAQRYIDWTIELRRPAYLDLQSPVFAPPLDQQPQTQSQSHHTQAPLYGYGRAGTARAGVGAGAGAGVGVGAGAGAGRRSGGTAAAAAFAGAAGNAAAQGLESVHTRLGAGAMQALDARARALQLLQRQHDGDGDGSNIDDDSDDGDDGDGGDDDGGDRGGGVGSIRAGGQTKVLSASAAAAVAARARARAGAGYRAIRNRAGTRASAGIGSGVHASAAASAGAGGGVAAAATAAIVAAGTAVHGFYPVLPFPTDSAAANAAARALHTDDEGHDENDEGAGAGAGAGVRARFGVAMTRRELAALTHQRFGSGAAAATGAMIGDLYAPAVYADTSDPTTAPKTFSAYLVLRGAGAGAAAAQAMGEGGAGVDLDPGAGSPFPLSCHGAGGDGSAVTAGGQWLSGPGSGSGTGSGRGSAVGSAVASGARAHSAATGKAVRRGERPPGSGPGSHVSTGAIAGAAAGGGDSDEPEWLGFSHPGIFSANNPAPLLVGSHEAGFNGDARSGATWAVSQRLTAPLAHVVGRAWRMFRSAGYVHHYTAYGVESDDFMAHFALLEGVVSAYQSM